MQRLRQSLVSLARLGYETAAAARVGGPSTSGSSACSSLPGTAAGLARQHSTATATRVGELDRAEPNYLQQLKGALKPEVSGRNRFHRKWQKALQMKASLGGGSPFPLPGSVVGSLALWLGPAAGYGAGFGCGGGFDVGLRVGAGGRASISCSWCAHPPPDAVGRARAEGQRGGGAAAAGCGAQGAVGQAAGVQGSPGGARPGGHACSRPAGSVASLFLVSPCSNVALQRCANV